MRAPRCCEGPYQIVDDVEAVVLVVLGVDPAVGLLPHVVLQRRLVPEWLLTVQTLEAEPDSKTGTRQ